MLLLRARDVLDRLLAFLGNATWESGVAFGLVMGILIGGFLALAMVVLLL